MAQVLCPAIESFEADRMQTKSSNCALSVVAISGAALLFFGTYFHPMSADPNAASAAFAEYAADHYWVATHLLQLCGFALMTAALVLLSRLLAGGAAAALAAVGMAGAIAGLAVATALQAVDGVALKAMVDAWAAAAEPDKAGLFHAAFAVRQVEVGLAAMTSWLSGVTVTLFGAALLIDRRFARWLGVLAIAGGIPTAVAGIVIAQDGFSALAMMINMPANILLLCWMIGLGIWTWRWRDE